jgi:hypothetical protein
MMLPEQIAEAQRLAREWRPKVEDESGGGPISLKSIPAESIEPGS